MSNFTYITFHAIKHSYDVPHFLKIIYAKVIKEGFSKSQKALSFNPGLQYPHLHGPVHTPDNNRWDTPPV